MAAVIPFEHAPGANIASTTEIELTVLDNMRLVLYPQEIARAGEHNSAIFRIVSQPANLAGLPCRAEIRTGDGTNFYVLVTDGTFLLTSDIAVHGPGTLQLVWGDNTVSHRTQTQQYWVAPSLFAVDPSAPEYEDGLAQLSNAAFAGAGTLGTVLAFVNIYGREVARVTFPGAGIDEETANQLFLRLNGTNQMDGSLLFSRTNLGVVFDPNGISATIYCDTGLRLRRGNGNGEITIEDANGTQASRSPVMTQVTSDARYLRTAGGSLAGPLIASYASNNPSLSELVSRAYVDGRYVSIDGGQIVGPIIALYDASNPGPAALVARSYVDSAYLSLANGGQLAGQLSMAPGQRIITAMGSGNNPMLCIGSNDTGFWRSAGSVIFEIGFAAAWIFSGTNTATYVPLTLSAPPTLSGHATTKQYVDERRAPSFKFDIPVDFPLTASWQNLYVGTYAIPRGGISRVRVSLSASLRAVTQGGLSVVGISCQPEVAIDRVERQLFVYNLNGVTNGFTVDFYVDVNGAAPTLTLQAVALATNPPNNDITILGGDTFNIQRSQILIEDLGAR